MRAFTLMLVCLATPALAADFVPLVPTPIEDGAGIAAALRTYYTKHEYRIAMRDGVAWPWPETSVG